MGTKLHFIEMIKLPLTVGTKHGERKCSGSGITMKGKCILGLRRWQTNRQLSATRTANYANDNLRLFTEWEMLTDSTETVL